MNWATRRILAWRLIEYDGRRRRSRCAGGRDPRLWLPGDPGHRPGSQFTSTAVVDLVPRHGIWQGGLAGQPAGRAPPEERQARRGVPPRLRLGGRGAAQPRSVLHVLQFGAATRGARRPDPGYGLLRRAASPVGPEEPRRPALPDGGDGRGSPPPGRTGREASGLFRDDLLEDVAVEAEIGDQAFVRGVLLTERAEPPELAQAQAGVLSLSLA